MKIRTLLFVVAGVLVLLVAAAALFFFSTAERRHEAPPRAHNLRPDDSQLVLTGARIYARNCAACHGANGEGQGNWRERGPDGLLPAPPHDASGHTWHHPDEQLFAITKYGLAKLIDQPDYRTAMPVYDGVLSDQEIIAALSWIKAQWPAEIRRRHDEINARYRQSQSQSR